MFSTPLICSSRGATTVEATTSALAPGYCPVTLMIGGAISGYCAIGSRANATAPRITKTIERTEAKMGRSMKKGEISIERSRLISLRRRCARLRRWRGRLLRGDLAARPSLHQAVDDDPIIGPDTLLDNAEICS